MKTASQVQIMDEFAFQFAWEGHVFFIFPSLYEQNNKADLAYEHWRGNRSSRRKYSEFETWICGTPLHHSSVISFSKMSD